MFHEEYKKKKFPVVFSEGLHCDAELLKASSCNSYTQ